LGFAALSANLPFQIILRQACRLALTKEAQRFCRLKRNGLKSDVLMMLAGQLFVGVRGALTANLLFQIIFG